MTQDFNKFETRHIGPSLDEQKQMLKDLSFKDLESFTQSVIPENLLSSFDLKDLGSGLSETEALAELKNIVSQNRPQRSMIGMGFYNTVTPAVIQRNILENPSWYTSYTPYQAEISQGRLESLLNFQTMVCDLTQMDIANASMLDEGSSCAEAVTMAHAVTKSKSSKYFLDQALHPHVIEVVRTRMNALQIECVLGNPETDYFKQDYFSVVLSYPNTFGQINNYSTFTEQAKKSGAIIIVDADILALTLIAPPGQWGADIVVGSTQRFGVPMGGGGPHAAFFATKDVYKRSMPGRLVGLSVDQNGNRALRLTLQTREQHIRREKATSNVCTAQALLANMAAMYAVYHGPEGLKAIAQKINYFTQAMALALNDMGYSIANRSYFDTLIVSIPKAQDLVKFAYEKYNINIRLVSETQVGMSFDEASDLNLLNDLIKIFHVQATRKTTHLADHYFALAQKNNALSFEPANKRSSLFLTHKVFNSHHSETQLMRYIFSLHEKDVTLTRSMIPLGSCTMKLNATSELLPLSWPEVSQIHPYAPEEQLQGFVALAHSLEKMLCAVTGFSAVSFQPNSGAQGEYTGLLVIKEYFKSKGQEHRNICLIPSSAHGTNPASAAMVGYEVIVVACDEQGNINVQDLAEKAKHHKEHLAAVMVTYPSTHGVFEASIKEICNIVHEFGGQVYMDGANLNALVGWVRPADIGADVSHMNLHKTFAIPHGGGGPGVGPIGVKSHLSDFLPMRPGSSIKLVTSSPFGSVSLLTISWMYLKMMGASGLKRATSVAILNANYISHQLGGVFETLYKAPNQTVAHECILDFRPLKTYGIEVVDIAKRLMDYGFHAPTMSWPVAGTLMVEPTESESKAELDLFISALKQIYQECLMVKQGQWSAEDNPLKNAPHTASVVTQDNWTRSYGRQLAAYPLDYIKANKYWPPVGRVNDAYGDRNVFCTCPPTESWKG